MKLWSPAWINGEAIPPRFAAGRLGATGEVVAADNLSPPLAWADLPAGTRSLVVVCHDFDMPADPAAARAPDAELPADAARADFFHWLLIDLPPQPGHIDEGAFGRGFRPGGRPVAPGPGPARQGLNDFTRWFAGTSTHAGRYLGYDGPLPPPHDSLVHHYLFALYAVDVAQLPVPGEITGLAVRDALTGHVLGAATLSGTYTLNRRLAGG